MTQAKGCWWLLAAALLTLGSAGCADDRGARSLGDSSGGGTTGAGDLVDPASCSAEGKSESCSLTLDRTSSSLTCGHGTRTCSGGRWSPCAVQQTQTLPWDGASAQPGLTPQGLSTSVRCQNNPCDPYCWVYNEVPTEDGGIQPDGSVITDNWQQGSLADYPAGLVTKGLAEPCSSGFECQFDHYCKNPTKGSCAHKLCDAGTKLSSTCNSCASAVCAVMPGCCNNTWDASCVSKAKELCTIECGTGPEGKCFPYDPGVTNAECSGMDFTVAPPCGTRVPVCNRGTVTAPAGVSVYLYPANSEQYPLCAPDLTKNKGVCKTKTPIPPGQCVMVDDCPFDNANNFTLVVNPTSAGASPMAECSCENNWSLYNKGMECGAAACASAVNEAILSPLAMMVMLDRSGSMGGSIGGNQTRWSASVTALKSFFQDSGSADLRPALHSFPYSGVGSCASGDCGASNCADPIVEAAPLLAASGSADTQETSLVNTLNALTPNGGNTPTLPALQGSIQWAAGYMASHPGEKAIVVLVTDGEPNGCSSTATSVANAAAAGLQQGVRTYVIGVAGVAQSTIESWASAGGGKAFFVSGQSIAQQFLQAMKTIQGEAASCDLVWTPGATFDPTKASVIYTPGSTGVPTTLPHRSASADCGTQAGWYYDNNSSPSKITLCSKTCDTVKQDIGAKVELSIGCPIQYEPRVYTQTYQGSCPAGTRVEWKFLTYDTLTPDDSSVVFKVRTAPTSADLASQTFFTAATAKATPTNTQKCLAAGPAPACPVNLSTALGGKPRTTYPALELQTTLNPSSNKSGAPALKSWDVTYDCVPSE